MNKFENRNSILKMAECYARSGHFLNVIEIELRLRSDGYVNVRTILGGPETKRELLELCKQAKDK